LEDESGVRQVGPSARLHQRALRHQHRRLGLVCKGLAKSALVKS